MKDKKKKSKKRKGDDMIKLKPRRGWEIVQLPNGEYQWILRKRA